MSRGIPAGCAILATAVSIALTAWPGASDALLVHLPGRTLGYQPLSPLAAPQAKPESGGGKSLTDHGGPVMTSNTNYPLYWEPAGAPEYPAGYESGIDRYFEDLAHDSGSAQNTDSILAQYGDSGGGFANYSSHFGGALVDTDPYPANGCSSAPICITDEQIRAEIRKYVEAHGLPIDLEHEYFLLTPAGVESCFEAAGRACSAGAKHPEYCSYHGDIPVGNSAIVYANIPYLEGTNCDTGEEHPNGNASDAALGGGLVHEHSESVTDPELNAWYNSKGEEVADRCRTFKTETEFGEPLGTAPDGAHYNQVINGDLYWYQQEWSNETGACEQRTAKLPAVPTVTKVKPKSGSTEGGTTVAVTGTAYSGPVSVYFGGVEATAVTVNSSTSLTVVSPPGSAGTVSITVKTSGGTSTASKKAQFKYKAPKKKKK